MCAKLSKAHVKKIESKNKKSKKHIHTPKINQDKHELKAKYKHKVKNDFKNSKAKKKFVAVELKKDLKNGQIKKIQEPASSFPGPIERKKKKFKKDKKAFLAQKVNQIAENKKKVAPMEQESKAPGALKKKTKKNKKNPEAHKSKNTKGEGNLDLAQDDDKVDQKASAEKERKQEKSSIEHTIFVGNVPANTKKVQLIKLFAKFGKVKTVRFRTIDGKRIFKHKIKKNAQALNAYLVMEDMKAVEGALQLNGTEFKGNHIRVNRAKGFKEGDIDQKRIIFVGNLKYSATNEQLHNIFSSCGEIEYVRTIQSENGCKGVAYVCFKKRDSITLALELNNTLVDDRPIRVERYSKGKISGKVKEPNKKLTGAAKRIEGKMKKIQKLQGSQEKKQLKSKMKNEEKGKAPYRGLKSDSKKKFKKKKRLQEAQIMAKKLTPKGEKT